MEHIQIDSHLTNMVNIDSVKWLLKIGLNHFNFYFWAYNYHQILLFLSSISLKL